MASDRTRLPTEAPARLRPAQALARTGDYSAVFRGHTHDRHEHRFGDTLWVNPGEVLGWKGHPSVAVWDTEANVVALVELG